MPPQNEVSNQVTGIVSNRGEEFINLMESLGNPLAIILPFTIILYIPLKSTVTPGSIVRVALLGICVTPLMI